MRLPRTTKILGYEVSIRYKAKLGTIKDPSFGEYDPNTKTIYLVKGMQINRKKEVFIHEYLHAVQDVGCIKISHHGIELMSICMLQLLNDKKIKLWGG